MSSPFDLYNIPTRTKEQAEMEYKDLKKMYPHYSEEMLMSIALSSSGSKGYLSMILYPKKHDVPNS